MNIRNLSYLRVKYAAIFHLGSRSGKRENARKLTILRQNASLYFEREHVWNDELQ